MAKKLILTFTIIVISAAVYAEETPLQQIEGFNLQGYTETGTKSWEVHGTTADILGNDVKLTNVDADVYGEQKMKVTAETGLVNQATGKMRLEKDVVITHETGTQVLTDSLNWDRNQDLVTTEDRVFINDEKFCALGTGLKAQPGLKNVQLIEDVTVRMNTEQKKEVSMEENIEQNTNEDIKPETKQSPWVTIICDGPMTVDQAKSVAIFEKNVEAAQTDRTLKADRMEVYFNQETKQIKEVVCIGHVEIIQGENKSYSEKAIYKGAEQKLILLGRPKMIMLTQQNDLTKEENASEAQDLVIEESEDKTIISLKNEKENLTKVSKPRLPELENKSSERKKISTGMSILGEFYKKVSALTVRETTFTKNYLKEKDVVTIVGN